MNLLIVICSSKSNNSLGKLQSDDFIDFLGLKNRKFLYFSFNFLYSVVDPDILSSEGAKVNDENLSNNRATQGYLCKATDSRKQRKVTVVVVLHFSKSL